MLYIVSGDMFAKPYQCITCPVNLKGTLGNGLALYFKKRYSGLLETYQGLLASGELAIGRPQLVRTGTGQYICLFPTKDDWRDPSRPEYIEQGLQFIIDETLSGMYYCVDSIAFPALGCGKGQLDFERDVKPIMIRYLDPWCGEAVVFDR